MKKTYQVTRTVLFVNRLMAWLIRRGIAGPHTYLLSVRGRKSGRLHSNPVTLVEQDGNRWLVAAYGEVAWVRNARAAREVTLTRGPQSETLTIHELPAREGAPILKQYLALAPVVQPYFETPKDASVEAFAAEAKTHPVFLLESKAGKP